MAKDVVGDRFEKRKKDRKLRDLSRRSMSTEEVDEEQAVLAKAKEEQAKHPERYVLKPGETVGRNDPCPCGSGKKYKKCCGAKK